MDKLIYYPGFETSDAEWTKFALLYMDTLSPIVPVAGDKRLSEAFQKLCDTTDLIDVHRPEYTEGIRASLDALDQVERILTHPERYEPIFKRKNLVVEWKDPATHKIELFEDKYTDDWQRFCLSNALATQSPEGIYISKDVADVYMTILAQTIADSKGTSVITDQRPLDAYSVFIRKADHPGLDVLQTAQGVFELKLPRNIRNLSLEAVIRHRNRPAFRDKQRAFRRALDEFLSHAESGDAPEKFLKSLGSTWSDLSDEVVRVGIDSMTFGLAVWLVFSAPPVGVLKLVGQIAAGTSLVFGSKVAIRNVWQNTKTDRLARRFLSDLKKHSPG